MRHHLRAYLPVLGAVVPTGGRAAADVGQQVREELRKADERLRATVCAYEEKPSAIDDAVLGTADQSTSVEAVITGTFRLLRATMYAEASPMRADRDVLEAFCEQKDEFVGFYRSALTTLESYREIMEAYRAVKRRSVPPRPGNLERLRRDKHVHVEERDACLEAPPTSRASSPPCSRFSARWL